MSEATLIVGPFSTFPYAKRITYLVACGKVGKGPTSGKYENLGFHAGVKWILACCMFYS